MENSAWVGGLKFATSVHYKYIKNVHRGRWEVKKGINYVHLVIECPLALFTGTITQYRHLSTIMVMPCAAPKALYRGSTYLPAILASLEKSLLIPILLWDSYSQPIKINSKKILDLEQKDCLRFQTIIKWISSLIRFSCILGVFSNGRSNKVPFGRKSNALILHKKEVWNQDGVRKNKRYLSFSYFEA